MIPLHGGTLIWVKAFDHATRINGSNQHYNPLQPWRETSHQTKKKTRVWTHPTPDPSLSSGLKASSYFFTSCSDRLWIAMKRQDKSAWALIFNDTGVTGAVNCVSFCMRTWATEWVQAILLAVSRLAKLKEIVQKNRIKMWLPRSPRESWGLDNSTQR